MRTPLGIVQAGFGGVDFGQKALNGRFEPSFHAALLRLANDTPFGVH